ncbi:hypothetical protein DSCO28_58380 [Desulfosarcina ovata subsp. sediminis]|uniref:Uncharacterized protein n=1 Tax=Desulfosarcina ovata subsp. sediminis TaxID=885957 RepID=A0A5K7ZYD0_9BACT|nr:hypothetical protein [Desulfosarcina ovata]BBO85272.1 hypothetical protein DSCO28_58380 [Desulfosarcina ovata subsp. sediminis]
MGDLNVDGVGKTRDRPPKHRQWAPLHAIRVNVMTEKEIYLDDAAQQLFAQLEGIEEHKKGRTAAEMMADSLVAEQKQQDVWRILLCEIVQHIAAYLKHLDLDANPVEERQTFEQLSETLGKLARLSNFAERILVRYRGRSGGSDIPERMDYEILFGNMVVDLDLVPTMIKRHGTLLINLMTQLLDAFGIFSDRGINNLYLNLPKGDPESLKRLRLGLHLLSRLYQASDNPHELVLGGGQKQVVPVVADEKGDPSVNLTLVAGVNRLNAKTMRGLVAKVDAWIQKKEASQEGCRFTSVYNAIFGLPKISAQLIPPPLEINNVDWLMREESEKAFSREKAKVARIIASVEASPEKVAKVIKSVYGDDYPKINSRHLEERLGLSSSLLQTIDSKPRNEDARQEVLTNLQKRLDTVSDDVFDNLYASRSANGTADDGGTLIGTVHRQLYKMVSFFKGRSTTRKKLTAMVNAAIRFEDADYEILARDFRIDVEEARQLVETLGKCFNEKGRFVKSAFVEGLPRFARYEKKIFEFLWRHLKDVIGAEDRTAFLNSLQILTDRMKQPKRAFKILLEDFLKDPEELQFSDAKALILANLILHEYDKSLADIEITPEDIIFSQRGLDEEVARYAAWRLDRDQELFFTKVRTVHQDLCEALELGMTRKQRIPAKDLLGLERELYIFLSMVETIVGRSVLRSAVNEYGSPESDLYFLKESDRLMSHLLQNLRIAIRGLAHIGRMECIPALEAVKAREEIFQRLKKTKLHRDQSRKITEWVDEAVKIVKFRA